MNKVLTSIVWGCVLGVLILPSFSVLTQATELLSLTKATVVVLLLTAVGALAAWWRTISAGRLNVPLPDEVEAARRYAQFLIFPETRWVGWKAPKVSQIQWNECSDSPKNVATFLGKSRIKNLPLAIITVFLLGIVFEHGIFHGLKNPSSFERLLPFLGSPTARAMEISLLCFTALTMLHLLLCRISSLSLNRKGAKV
jgi:hypothetical protein